MANTALESKPAFDDGPLTSSNRFLISMFCNPLDLHYRKQKNDSFQLAIYMAQPESVGILHQCLVFADSSDGYAREAHVSVF